jgi:hypothetical protein
MPDVHVRHCLRCVTDFRPDVVYCVDCGAELVDRFEETDPERRRMPDDARPDAHEGPLAGEMPPGWSAVYFASTATELGPLADRLAARGIALRILGRPDEPATEPPREHFELWVADVDRATVLEDIRDLAGPATASCDTPGCPGSDCGAPDEVVPVPDADFDPRTGYRQCPACGARLNPRAPECPDCGLALGGGEAGDAPGPPVEPT